jgi:predicted membrane protein
MKSEKRILTVVSIYACVILAQTSTSTLLAWLWVALAVYWSIIFYKLKKKNPSIFNKYKEMLKEIEEEEERKKW